MKKKVLLIALGLLATVLISALAAGDAGDPLISLSYLNGAFTSTVEKRVSEKLDASDAALSSGKLSDSQSAVAVNWEEQRLKAQDVLIASTGTGAMLLAGEMQVTFPSGAVIDVSTGSAISSGSSLLPNHRYLVAEETQALFSVTSKTAVIDYQGSYAFARSDATDYNAMASALKTLHLFQGSFTGYGQGFDLELAPTRLQALIMFIRVLGEESAALAYSGETPFRDIAPGSQAAQYVGYAVSKGYSNGYTATTFRPGQAITANQYVEFMLRALGYSSTANTDLSSTLTRAMESSVLTGGEVQSLQGAQFLRADLAYVSYYALDAGMSDGSGTLRHMLLSKKIFTEAEAEKAASLVTGPRK